MLAPVKYFREDTHGNFRMSKLLRAEYAAGLLVKTAKATNVNVTNATITITKAYLCDK